MEYVCDFCENKVNLKDTSCSMCGAIFSDVKCPQCSYKGKSTEFKRGGCPNCAYRFLRFSGAKTSKKSLNISTVTVILLSISIPLMLLILFRLM